ncbi:hypothetical protein L6164_026654 [Bauhinia variegata]|uniref:Uncharacterized protein n=1 Tax=Bauhinia variegata TaxID=167791 RepID=A0ACB9LQR7_BAUVA|nr:hypothetical protein L6164_026654 [Bauhinia variegata]
MKKRSTPSSICSFNNDVVYEILTWLPAKSLMRFKALNKFWSTIITHDSFFIHIHRRRSGSRIAGEKLLFHQRHPSGRYKRKHKFISIDNDGRKDIMEYPHECPYPYEQVGVLVVDSFVCFYSKISFSTISASLYNLSTHESIALPKDSNFYKGLWKKSFFSFGFDSKHTLCKILHKSNLIASDIVDRGFEVYTVGDTKNSWRTVNPPPFECHHCVPYNEFCFCINGVIYWFSRCDGENKCYKGVKITAFDVSEERFHLISLPLDSDRPYHLTNVKGLPTLWETNSFFKGLGYVKLWKLEDCKNQVWATENILIDIDPRSCDWRDPHLIGTTGSGEILMEFYLDGNEVLIYYDRARRMSKAVELDTLLPKDEYHTISSYTYIENIMPLISVSN